MPLLPCSMKTVVDLRNLKIAKYLWALSFKKKENETLIIIKTNLSTDRYNTEETEFIFHLIRLQNNFVKQSSHI